LVQGSRLAARATASYNSSARQADHDRACSGNLSIEMYCFSAVFEQVEQARTRGRGRAMMAGDAPSL
jgi:hypothetical protein